MINRKVLGTIVAGVALGAVAMPLAPAAWAASETKGLVSLSLQGVGSGTLGAPACSTIACSGTDICDCLSADYLLIGNQGFAKGSLTITLSVDTTDGTNLPISDLDLGCSPAAGTATLSNPNSKFSLTLNVSGLECPTVSGPDVFNGTYVVTSGTGKYSSASGAGRISGSQIQPSGLAQVAITGTVQP